MRSKLHTYEWPNCKKSLLSLVENGFYFVLERFVYRRQHCQNDPVHVDLNGNERPKCMKQSKNSRVKTPEC